MRTVLPAHLTLRFITLTASGGKRKHTNCEVSHYSLFFQPISSALLSPTALIYRQHKLQEILGRTFH
jgi:hypothetical protein